MLHIYYIIYINIFTVNNEFHFHFVSVINQFKSLFSYLSLFFASRIVNLFIMLFVKVVIILFTEVEVEVLNNNNKIIIIASLLGVWSKILLFHELQQLRRHFSKHLLSKDCSSFGSALSERNELNNIPCSSSSTTGKQFSITIQISHFREICAAHSNNDD